MSTAMKKSACSPGCWTSIHLTECLPMISARFPHLDTYHLLELVSRLLDPLSVITVYHEDEALGGEEERKQKGSLPPRSCPNMACCRFSHLVLY